MEGSEQKKVKQLESAEGITVEVTQAPTASVKRYKKTTGRADMSGELYEVKVAALLFCRALNSMENFHLASNMAAAGAFDDVILRLGPKTMFLQLKHRSGMGKIHSSQLIQLRGDFSLLKYYKSYCEVKQQWTKNKDLQYCGGFEDFNFFIYTNATVGSSIVSHTDDWHSILSSGGTCLRFTEQSNPDVYDLFRSLPKYTQLLSDAISGNQPEELLDIVRKLWNNKAATVPSREDLIKMLKELQSLGDVSDHKEFLSHLQFCSGQAAENQLDDLIKQEIKTAFGVDTLFVQFIEGVQNWWRHSNKFLTDKIQFWQDIVQSCVSSISHKKMSELSALKIRFHEHALHPLKAVLPPAGGMLHVINNVMINTLTSLKVYQSIGSKLLVDGSTLHSRLDEVLALWRQRSGCDVLVVDGEMGSGDVVAGVAEVLHSCLGKTLVLIVCDTDHIARVLLHWFKGKTYTNSFSLSELEQESQDRILECEVTFQGFPIRLKSLAHHTMLVRAVTTDIVVQLLIGDKDLLVGEKLTEQDDCYITRNLLRREHVHKEIFSVKGTQRLAVSGASLQELQQLVPLGEAVEKFDPSRHSKQSNCRYFIVDEVSDVMKLSEIYDSTHWLHKQEDSFVWKQSKGDVTFITNHLAQTINPISYSNMQEIMKFSHQMVLVVAEPGMGKSTILSHLASEVKQTNLSSWVVRVDLNHHTDYLSQQQSSVNLLMTAGKFNTEFEKSLFEHELHHGGNVVVMFDGFDEISPKYAGRVIEILRDLADTKIKKLWVTSRPIMREMLERELSSLPFALEPFSQDDQMNFLSKFWEGYTTHSHNISTFITKLLELTARSLNDSLAAFAGIPLQTKMLAEAFQTEASHYCKTGEEKLPHMLDLLQLYNRFVDRKWEVYYEKNKMDIRKAAVTSDDQFLRDLFHQNYMNCALVTLLEPDELKKLQNSRLVTKKVKEFLAKFKTGLDNRGLVIDVKNERPIFAHRTFAEYFAAMWFAQNYDSQQDYLKEKLFDPDFQIFRSFFDRILAQEFPLHVAILNQDKVLVEALLSENKIDVNTRDEGGRTTLYLAVISLFDSHDDDDPSSSPVQQIIVILLKHGADPDIKDEVLCWQPLRVAERIGAWSTVELLLEVQEDTNDLILITHNIDNKMYVQDVLRAVTRQGLVKLLAFMLRCGIDVRHPINVVYKSLHEWAECTVTLLHEAARHGQVKLVQFLLDHKSDLEARDSWYKCTALMWAAEQGHLQVIELLTQKGASISACSHYELTALLLAASNGNCDVFKLLSQQHTDITTCDKFGRNALHLAALSGGTELVGYILDTKLFDIDCFTEEKHTPLWLAAQSGQLQVVKLLCDHGADLDVQDTDWERTPLHVASERGHLQVVKLLTQQGASVAVCDKHGHTALLLAACNGQSDVFKVLSQQKETDVTACNTLGFNALHFFARFGHVERVAHLLDMKRFDINCRTEYQQTPLWFAAAFCRLQVTQLLCEHGADLNIQGILGLTPLHAAAGEGDLQVVQCLVQHGANLFVCDREGRTPLDEAVKRNNPKVAKFLRHVTQ